MKKIIISIFLVFIVLNMCIYCQSIAAPVSLNSAVTYMGNVTQGITNVSSNNTVIKVINTIIRIVQVAAIGVMTWRITYLGILYFTVHRNSPQEEVALRSRLIRNIFYGVIVYGAVGIFELIYNAINP